MDEGDDDELDIDGLMQELATLEDGLDLMEGNQPMDVEEEEEAEQPQIEEMEEDEPPRMTAQERVAAWRASHPDHAPLRPYDAPQPVAGGGGGGRQQRRQQEEEEVALPPRAPDRGRRRQRRQTEEVEMDDDRGDYAPLPLNHIRLNRTADFDEYFEYIDQLQEEDARMIDLDAETEEEAAGMVLPRMVLDDKDLYMRTLFTTICRMGNETTRLLTKILVQKEPISEEERHKCRVWVRYWTAYVVEHHYTVLGKVMTLPIGPNGAPQRIAASANMMWEIWRLKLILKHRDLGTYKSFKIKDSEFLWKWLIETPGTDLDKKPILPDKELAKAGPAAKEKYDALMVKYNEEMARFAENKLLVDTPILLMKQSQVRHFVQFLTSRIEIIPYNWEIRKLIKILELKTAMFMCRSMPAHLMDQPNMRTDLKNESKRIADMLDAELAIRRTGQLGDGGIEEDAYKELMEEAEAHRKRTKAAETAVSDRFGINRDYLMFCTCYFFPLMRGLYYAKMFPRIELARANDVESYLPPGAVARFEAWYTKLAKAQGDKYLDRLEDVANYAMIHPGDQEWMGYRYPDESTHVDVVLRKGRGEHAYYNYHAQTGLSYEVVLSQVGVNRVSDMYVMSLFDRYMSTYKKTNWAGSYVINSGYIDEEETFDKWSITREPMLICVFSNYWLMIDRKVLQIDDIRVAILMWMLSIRRTRKLAGKPADCLEDNVCITDLIDGILYGKGLPEYIVDTEVHAEYVNKLKRGLAPETTRIPI